jgi:hypothetical protein
MDITSQDREYSLGSTSQGHVNMTLIETDEYVTISNDSATTEVAKFLYSNMKIAVDVKQLENVVKDRGAIEFLITTLGRVFNKEMIAMDALSEDVKSILACHQIKSRYKYAVVRDNVVVPQCSSTTKFEADSHSITNSMSSRNSTTTNSTNIIDPTSTDIFNQSEEVFQTSSCIVVFNVLYKIATTICNPDFVSVINKNLTDEFVVIGELVATSTATLNQCRSYFNKKAFASTADVTSKFTSFCALHDVDTANNEKQRVHRFMLHMYTITTDPAFRVKASDLYCLLKKHVTYDEPSQFRARMYGYLLELGIVKTRFSDGYYYFGLQKRFDSVLPSNIEDVMTRREREMDGFKPIVGGQIPLPVRVGRLVSNVNVPNITNVIS